MLVATVQPLPADSSAGSATLPAPATLAPEQVLAQLAPALAAHFKTTGELELAFVRAWTPPVLGAREWRVVVADYPAALASNLIVRCQLLADGAPAGEYSLVLRASLWADAWAARQPLAAQSVFDPTLLDTRRVDLLRERDALPATAGDSGFVFGRAVAAGRVLAWRDLARRPLVRKGALVEVSAADGPLVVTLKAVALENGAHGDTVTLRNRESRRDFSATVVDENRVQVRF